ncbi:MAG TPA: hypothetical protein VL485_33480 [Ktedonobacteraceae bacterium]|jgi:nucleoside phosphorylase|nr:hypothetical protein [Ktedonobacteraceae bacterium]
MDHDETTLFFDSTPLPQNETAITLELYSLEDDTTVRNKTETTSFQQKVQEGKITLNPSGIQLFALPPQRPTASFSFAPDRTKWDLYLVVIPFTLHRPTRTNAHYARVTFSITLNNQHVTALDLFPKDILSSVEGRKFTLSRDGRFSTTEDPTINIGSYLDFDDLQPIIRAAGGGQNSFYWTFTGTDERKGVPFDSTKNVLVVLQVPRDTSLVEGEINYRVDIKRPFFRVWKSENAKVDPYPIRWPLQNLPALFSPEPVQPAATSVDVCLVCALPEEARALIEVIEEQCQVQFAEGHSEKLRRDYRHAFILNKEGEPLHILITWQPNPGSMEAGLLLNDFIREYQPRFVGMTGICAGDREKTALGDIIVAERAFSYETGKIERDEQGQKKQTLDTTTWQLQPDILQMLGMFDGWKSTTRQLKRPISLRQQRDWLLETLLHTTYQNITVIPEQECNLHAPQWRQIWQQLRTGPAPSMTAEGSLTEYAQQRHTLSADFPYHDPPHPRVHIGPVATGDKVRTDDPFAEINKPVRKTLALDMEGAAFYRVMANFPATPALFAKGVCDYATSEKDDSFHSYAASVSAMYMLSFIRTFLTTKRFPRK